MRKYFKVFALESQREETFGGYSDGYGKEYISHPVFKGIDGFLSNIFDTELDAEEAIDKHGHSFQEYIILPVYQSAR